MENGQRNFHPCMNARARLIAPRSLISLFFLFASLALANTSLAQNPGTWAQLATNMNQARYGHTATLLSDGKVFIVGGKDAAGQVLSTAEIYDAASGLYTSVNSNLPTPVWGHAATLLRDGTVLIAGGKGSLDQPVSALQSFDPNSGLFAQVGALTTPRWRHTATPLSNGQILIAGGNDGLNVLSSLELYQPKTQVVQNVAITLATPRENHTATLLSDGQVLIIGGSNGLNATVSAELYDRDDGGTIRTVGSLVTARTLMSAALLLDGSVLVAGGQDVLGQDLGTIEIYNPSEKTFTQLQVTLATPRSGHLGLVLPYSGKVLFAGGNSAGAATANAEMYDPLTGIVFPVEPSVDGRQLFGANFLEPPFDGTLFTTGGLDTFSNPLASSEAFFFPTIRSDKLDYQPGDTIYLTGAGWLPGETVTITIHESSADPDTTVVVIADANGAISNDQLQINSGDAGVDLLPPPAGRHPGGLPQQLSPTPSHSFQRHLPLAPMMRI